MHDAPMRLLKRRPAVLQRAGHLSHVVDIGPELNIDIASHSSRVKRCTMYLWQFQSNAWTPKQKRALDLRVVGPIGHVRDRRRAVGDLGFSPDFQPRLVRIIHQKQAGVMRREHVAGGNVLAVPAKVCEAERRCVEPTEEACWPATILHVRPAILADGGHVQRVARCDKLRFLRPDPVRTARPSSRA